MRGFLFAALLAFPAIRSTAQEAPSTWKPIFVDHWGGLNVLQDSTMIDGDAQTAQNVLTDNTYLEKRPGNVRLATILSGSPVSYVNDWAAPNGNRYLIAQASNTIYQTNFSAGIVALSTIAIGNTITTVPAFSKLEFADSYRPLWYWNDVSTAQVTDAASGNVGPICTYITFKDARIWCANLPSGFTTPGNTTNGGGQSTVIVSSAGGDGYWAVPSNASSVDNAPNRWDFNPDDGESINCLATTPFGTFVGKQHSTYFVKGTGNISYVPLLLDPKIGCVDNRSVQMVYGVLEWLAVDGVYGYDGSGPPHLLTRDLDPLMQTIREATFSQGQWATQLQSDWQNGTESTTTLSLPALPWDYTTIPASIFPSSFSLFDDNTNPGLQTNGRIGFSSDTLVNIDTTSLPLSIGAAQVMPSTGGVQVWRSYFAAGNYTTITTTWTVFAGIIAGSGGGQSDNVFGDAGGTVFYTMANSSTPTPGSLSAWNYGAWSVVWEPAGGGINGFFTGNNGDDVMDFGFAVDSPQKSAMNGYGVDVVTNGNCAGASPGTCNYTANIYKSVAGIRTTLSFGNFTMNSSSSWLGYSTMTVVLSPGGYINLYQGGNLIAAANAGTLDSKKAILTRIAPGFIVSGASSLDLIQSVTLNGFGTGSIVSRVYDTGMGAPLAGLMSSTYTLQGVTNVSLPETEIDFFVRYSTSPNNDLWSSFAASSNSILAVMPRRYWQYEALFTSRIASATAQLSSFSLPAVSTGNYFSNVDFIGSLITSWRQFNVTEATPGVYNYYVREATYSFSPSQTSPGWVAQTANQNVNLSVSTPTYAQFRLDSTPLALNAKGASASEPISAVFLRWNQGTSLPVASATLERRYLLCVTISTSATAPDTCLLRQKNGKWVTWIGPSVGSMGYYNNQMVVGDGSTNSRVWLIMQPNVYQDDGVPINSIWTSADFIDGHSFNNNIYHEAWIDALPVKGSSVTFSYSVSKAGNFVGTTLSTDDGLSLNPALPVIGSQLGNVSKWIEPLAGYDSGKYIDAQFSDNTLSNYFRVNSYLLYIEPQLRQVP